MRSLALLAVLASALVMACDKTESQPPPAASASAAPAASAPPAASSAAPEASAAPSAAPSASAAAPEAPATKDVTVTVRDPEKEPSKTVKAPVGGSVTVYLPQYPGSKWTVAQVDKTLGKPKEETIPGFAGPSTPAHAFKWTTASPLLKAGQTHKVKLVNTKGGKPGPTFELTIDVVG